MPRFAANLGFTPLEPMKTDLPSVHHQQPTVSQPEPAPEVPAAKFDWTSSGLVNPLDCKYFQRFPIVSYNCTQMHIYSVYFWGSFSNNRSLHSHPYTYSNTLSYYITMMLVFVINME